MEEGSQGRNKGKREIRIERREGIEREVEKWK